jgi:hypothetical protein
VFFPTPAHFRKWLEKNHATATELWVAVGGFLRRGFQGDFTGLRITTRENQPYQGDRRR